jgi:hypothetical protein
VVAAALMSLGSSSKIREPENLLWSCQGWNSFNVADCHRWGGGNFLTFDNASRADCYGSPQNVVALVTPSRSNVDVEDYGAIPGDEYVNHLATCLVSGHNAE